MSDHQAVFRGTRGIQQSLFAPPAAVARPNAALETKGVVYTKRWVVELILDLAGYRPERDLASTVAVEPSAGDGAFIGRMIERLIESCRRSSRKLSDCHGSLRAFELSESSARGTRALARSILLQNGVGATLSEELANAWIRPADYLTDGMEVEADFVIGNPPYVRLEDIPEETAETYRDAYPTMRGRADLYVAFFEAALRSLRPNGVCAFICADRWMRNQYGGELRRLVTSAFAVDAVIEMHNADAFHDEVDAYPAITVIRRAHQRKVLIATLGPQAGESRPDDLIDALQPRGGQNGNRPVPGVRTAVIDTWFKSDDPWPCQSPEQLALLRRIEERFPSLEDSAKVGIGVATGNDGVFITTDRHLVEPSRLLKLALAKDIVDGTMKWSGHYLVDPWNGEGLVTLERFPKLQSYFAANAEALKKRHTAAKNIAGWYRTIDRVTHALTSTPKLYIADIKDVLAPVLDRGETYPHHNLYYIQSEEWDLEELGGLLLSVVGQFFVESYGVRMRGGYLRFQAQYLRRIRVPAPGTIDKSLSRALGEAFRKRDRALATEIALRVYGIGEGEMETALGH